MSTPIRLGLFYAAIYLSVGATSPYMPLWFAEHGLTGGQIGLILALPMLSRAFTAPLMAVWADSFRLRRTPLILLSLGTAAGYLLLAAPFGFPWWVAVWFVSLSLFAALIPLTDVIGLSRARREGFNYGFPRGFGSVSFVVANIGLGLIIARQGADPVLVWIVSAMALTAAGAWLLVPADPVHEDGGAGAPWSQRMAGVGELLRDPLFMTAVLSASLIQAAHAFYYSFSTLAWTRQGIGEDISGLLWATGVAVEIVFLWFLEPWRRRVGPRILLVLGGAAAVVRWTAMAFSPPLWLLFPLQALHALTYAATFLASLQLVERLSAPRNASAAQSINAGLASGVLSGLATLASGWLFDRVGAQGYVLMAVMSGLGLAGAVRLLTARRLHT